MGIEVGALAAYAALAATAVSVGTSVMSAQKQKEQAAEAQKQADAQKRLTDLQNQRAARDAVRKQRIAQAQVENAAALNGTNSASGTLGGVASIQSQTEDNLGYLAETGGLQDSIFGSAKRSAGIGEDIGTLNTIGGVAGGIAKGANSIVDATQGYESLFSDSTSKTGDGRIHGEAPQ